MTDFETVNSPEFINAIRPFGLGGYNMLEQDFNRVKRRFDPHAPKGGGTVILVNQQKHLVANWAAIKWAAKDAAGHWGYLHFVCPLVAGAWGTWPVEKLRDVERTGTSSIDATQWFYPDGTPYKDAWDVMISGKITSPHENRNQSKPNYLPHPGSLCAFWVGTWHGGQSPNRRTDLLPFRYEPLSVPKPSPGPEPPPPPVEPPTPGTGPLGDAQIDDLASRIKIVRR